MRDHRAARDGDGERVRVFPNDFALTRQREVHTSPILSSITDVEVVGWCVCVGADLVRVFSYRSSESWARVEHALIVL